MAADEWTICNTGITIYASGSEEAKELLERAIWSGLGHSSLFDPDAIVIDKAHIARQLIPHLDAVVVKDLNDEPDPSLSSPTRIKTAAVKRAMAAKGQIVHKAGGRATTDCYSMASLIERDEFHRHDKPAAILHVSSPSSAPTIMAIFLNENLVEINLDLEDLVRDHEKLYSVAKANFPECQDRTGIFMAGLRINENSQMNPSMTVTRAPGYYAAKNLEAGMRMTDATSVAHQTIRKAASLQCKVESLVSPYLAHCRLHARHPHPGLLPGIPREVASASSIGLSKGYGSFIHSDKGYGGLTETISWNTSSVSRDSGLAFAIWTCRVVFDLCASSCNFVMVPSTVYHGTCPTPLPHDAIGFATLTNGRLSNPTQYDSLKALEAKIKDPQMSQFLNEGFLFRSRSPFYCCLCGEDSHSLPCLSACASKIERERRRNKALQATPPVVAAQSPPGAASESKRHKATKKTSDLPKGQKKITDFLQVRRTLQPELEAAAYGKEGGCQCEGAEDLVEGGRSD